MASDPPNEARLELAWTLRADVIVDVRQGPLHEAVRRLTDDQGVDVLVAFVANQDTLPSSCQNRLPRVSPDLDQDTRLCYHAGIFLRRCQAYEEELAESLQAPDTTPVSP
jgi:threonine dehydrogenase-like Zn-dependent dehydrogenase